MSFKKLKGPSGLVDSAKADEQTSTDKLVRPGILVHSGAEGEGVTYQSMDGETKPFDAERIKLIVENQNKVLDQLAAEYGGWDKIPDGAFPPLLDSHESDSSHKVLGRMTSKLRYEVRDVPKVGKNVSCAVTDITFLGAENIQKVKDGRVYHLSVGIDENADTLGETSAVVEPAAPGAMLLGKGNTNPKGVKVMDTKALSASSKKRLSILASMKEDLTKLSSKLVASSETLRLAKASDAIKGRLTKLSKAGKLTPAEIKNLDIKKLAALPADALETVMSAYEALEPKVIAGQRGSSDPSQSVDFGGIGAELEKRQQKRLKAEVRGELKKMGARLKESPAEEKENEDHGKGHEMAGKKKMADEAQDQKRASASPEMKEHLKKMAEHIEKGDMEGVKACHASMCAMAADEKHMSGLDDVHSEDGKKSMEEMQMQLDEVKTNMARMAGMMDEMMASESEDSKTLDEGAQPPPTPEKKPAPPEAQH